ncbi:hypothetical protein [Deinococcus aestuarii]|uniref:hypothetical protein n=1 Tax=Deinococcus aestuarii TaxID=2774531 RepID=UPI001C0AD9F5|nr:hypothetical protein [Deinococcus aestuarii]
MTENGGMASTPSGRILRVLARMHALPVTPGHYTLAAELSQAQTVAAVRAYLGAGEQVHTVRVPCVGWPVYRVRGEALWITYLGLGDWYEAGDPLEALLVAAGRHTDPLTGTLKPLHPKEDP